MGRKICTSILALLGVTATVFPNSAFVLGPNIDTQDAIRRIHSKMTVPCSDENLLHWSGFYSISPYVSALAVKNSDFASINSEKSKTSLSPTPMSRNPLRIA